MSGVYCLSLCLVGLLVAHSTSVFLLSFSLDMPETPADVTLTFDEARRLSLSQVSKLSKRELTEALKDAIDSAERKESFTSQSIKTMICEAVQELKKELAAEQMKFLTSLEERLNLQLRELQLTKEVMRNEIESEIMTELNDRQNRRNNLLVFGVPESEGSDDEDPNSLRDDDQIESIFTNLGATAEKLRPMKFFRLGRRSGRPRPIKLLFSSFEEKQSVLRAAPLLSRLQPSNPLRRIYIKPDMSLREQAEERKLRSELKERKEQGEDVTIRNGKIVSREPLKFRVYH